MFRNIFNILFAAILLIVTHASAAQLERNTDRPGSDYSSFDLPAADPQMCASRCEQDGRCRAFTYVSPGIQGPNARCWLKDQIPNPVSGRAGIVSGVMRHAGPPAPPTQGGSAQLEMDVDRPGSDYTSFDLPAANPQLCSARCDQDSRCRSFSYVSPGIQGPNARCWLKDRIPNPVTGRAGIVSGVTRPTAPPVTGNPSGVWNLKEIRVRNTMDGNAGAVTRQQYDANGGDVEVNMSGNILNFCPGGFERIRFTWRFDRAMTQITHGSGVSAHLDAHQSGKSSNCGVQLAMRSYGTLNASAGSGYQMSTQERPLVDGERFQAGNGKRVAAAEQTATQRPGAGTVRVNTHAIDPQKIYAYFYVYLETPTAPGGGQLSYIYIYELVRN